MLENEKFLVLNQLDQAKDLLDIIKTTLYDETKLKLLGTKDIVFRTEDNADECDKLDTLCKDFDNIQDLLEIYKTYVRVFLK